jgi:Ser/Thr protein kinase RdoA (MazF antagonist)
MPDEEASSRVQMRWKNFIAAYRDRRPVADADLAAIARFMAVRQFWLLGELAGRVPVWGSQTMTTGQLHRQVELLRQWELLQLPT